MTDTEQAGVSGTMTPGRLTGSELISVWNQTITEAHAYDLSPRTIFDYFTARLAGLAGLNLAEFPSLSEMGL